MRLRTSCEVKLNRMVMRRLALIQPDKTKCSHRQPEADKGSDDAIIVAADQLQIAGLGGDIEQILADLDLPNPAAMAADAESQALRNAASKRRQKCADHEKGDQGADNRRIQPVGEGFGHQLKAAADAQIRIPDRGFTSQEMQRGIIK